jgi:hypothetical protein
MVRTQPTLEQDYVPWLHFSFFAHFSLLLIF